jgi:hypothetical protein
MGKSKQLFELMAQQELNTNNFLPTKKELQLSAKKFTTEILDAGEVDKIELFAQAVRLNEVLSIVTDELKNSLPAENFEAFGIKGTYRNGGETLNYIEDWLYAELQEKLKQRAELIKVATNSKELIFDENGIEVTKVSKNIRKSSLSISF